MQVSIIQAPGDRHMGRVLFCFCTLVVFVLCLPILGSDFLPGVWWYRNTKIVGAMISVVVRKSFEGCRSHVNLLTPLLISKYITFRKKNYLMKMNAVLC